MTTRDAWHLKRVRLFFDWFASAMRQVFAGYEAAVAPIVGLPPDYPPYERHEIHFTSRSRSKRNGETTAATEE